MNIFNLSLINTVILFLTVFFLLYKYLTRNYSYWEKKNVYYPKPVPVFGNFFDVFIMKKMIGEYLSDLYKRTNDPYFGIYIFTKPYLVIRSPELVKNILIRDFNYFVDRTIANSNHDQIVSNLLFFDKGLRWKQLRTKLTPLFTSGKLKSMSPLINDCAKNMLTYLNKNPTDENIEAKEVFAKLFTDVIAKCAFAINAHSFQREDAEFRNFGRMVFDFRISTAISQLSYFFLPGLVKLFRLNFIDPKAKEFVEKVFWQAIDTREKSNVKGNDMIDLILDIRKNKEFVEENNFEKERIVAQPIQFFLAGFETTSATAGFLLYELCIHPEIQKKLRDEIKNAIKQDGITYDTLNNIKYLDMCINETLRKYPVLPFLDRVCEQDYKVPNSDLVIEKGTPVLIPMFGLHFDEKYFPNPNEFIPERFEDNSKINVNGISYIPFGEGPRNCIGARFGLLATKYGIVHILTQYEVSRTKETPVPLQFETKSILLQSKVGLPMKFTKSPLL